MFHFGFSNYMQYGFPRVSGEMKPIIPCHRGCYEQGFSHFLSCSLFGNVSQGFIS